MILDHRRDQDWDFSPPGLDAAAARLERLHVAAGRPGPGAGRSDGAVMTAMPAALADDLDVPAALRIAENDGGQAARALGSLPGLW